MGAGSGLAEIRAMKAWAFAEEAHARAGQVMKYTGEPYIVHCEQVALVVAEVAQEVGEVEAALLHDVLEDTDTEAESISQVFGDTVLSYVQWVTNERAAPGRTRRDRKEADRARMAVAPRAAQTIKLADMIVNASTIRARDPGFSVVYLQELQDMLLVLKRGDVRLRRVAEEIICGSQSMSRAAA